jgi:hypothetical protein
MTAPQPRPRRRKPLNAGPFAPEIGSFRLHVAAEGKAPNTVRTYTVAVAWFARRSPDPCTRCTRWEQVSGHDMQRWLVYLLSRYSDAYASNQFRVALVRREHRPGASSRRSCHRIRRPCGKGTLDKAPVGVVTGLRRCHRARTWAGKCPLGHSLPTCAANRQFASYTGLQQHHVLSQACASLTCRIRLRSGRQSPPGGAQSMPRRAG